ncbi:MAG: hypothetical protein RIR00_866 [Pseudomonadota bacterium]
MTTLATATFTGANGAAVETADTNWTGSNATISGNAARNNTASTAQYYHSQVPTSADYDVSADTVIFSASGSRVAAVTARHSTSASTYYAAQYTNTGGGWRLLRFVAGVQSQLGASAANPVPTTTTVCRVTLRVEGSAISLYVDGALTIGPITDTAIADAGRGGFRINASAVNLGWDNWSLDTLGGAAIDLSGTATATATATGALTTSIRLSGAATAQATATGALTTGIRLSGAATAQATATGALTTEPAGISLSGTARAEATASGALFTSIRLSGTATAQATATGALTVEPAGNSLSGTARAESTATGALTTEIRFSGTAAAIATARGALIAGSAATYYRFTGRVRRLPGLTASVRRAATLTTRATHGG